MITLKAPETLEISDQSITMVRAVFDSGIDRPYEVNPTDRTITFACDLTERQIKKLITSGFSVMQQAI